MQILRFVVTCCLGLGTVEGCTSSEPTYLASDTTFLRTDVPQCVEQNPTPSEADGDPCCQLLVFYATGQMSKLSGLEGFPGHYELDGQIARGTVFGQDFAFDLSTNSADAPFIAGPWIADTENLSSIACLP